MQKNAVDFRKREEFLQEHRDEVDSLLFAGMDINTLKEFSKASATMILTESSAATATPSVMPGSTGTLKDVPSRATPDTQQPVATPKPRHRHHGVRPPLE
jgi:hypothetical protein